jgi:hypothetical protein
MGMRSATPRLNATKEDFGRGVEEHFKKPQSLLLGCPEERLSSSCLVEDAIYHNGAARASDSHHRGEPYVPAGLADLLTRIARLFKPSQSVPKMVEEDLLHRVPA